MKTIYLLYILLAIFTLGCSSDDTEGMTVSENGPTVALEATTMLDISYGDHPDQAYDLYLPKNRTSKKTKVVLLVHGGGWIEGDKASMQVFIDYLQNQHPDYAIANINYRLAQPPLVPAFPHQFLDVGRVIDVLREQSEELQIKPEFGIIGTSAGAHLAMQYDYVYDVKDEVKMVCNIVGPSNLTDPFYTEDSRFALVLPFMVDRQQYPAGTDLAAAVSPALQVTAASSPTIMFYGTTDPLVPVSNAEVLRDNLDAFNIPNQLTVYEGGHGNWAAKDEVDLQQKVTSFLNLYLEVATD
ncbi:MAG: alpha/beta hydrolase [Leeuwenhoekiella sp.]